MKIYNDITVDLYDLYPLKKVEAQQNNVGRGARITLTAGGLVLSLDGESVTMWAKKPDGMYPIWPVAWWMGRFRQTLRARCWQYPEMCR